MTNTISIGVIFQIMLVLQAACFGDDTATPRAPGAYLGIFAYEVNSPVLRKHLQLPEKTGLLIVAVADNSPAQSAGLEVYDILLGLDNVMLTNMNQLRQLIGAKQPGDTISLSLLSAGKKKTVTPVLGTRPTSAAKMPPDHDAQTLPPGDKTATKPAPRFRRPTRMALEIDLDELIRIASDSNLSQGEKKQKVNALVTRDLLKGLRLKESERDADERKADLHKRVERALSPLAPATQEQLRQRIFDADGNVKDSVKVLETDKGPLIIVEETSQSKPEKSQK